MGLFTGRRIDLGFLFSFLLLALPAFASGGSCPSGANYLNPATNTQVTLSNLGITNCYYVAANGSDSNSGTSESSPFLHSPGMQNCSNNCGAVSLAPGMGIIFRGRDTYHFGNSSATPYAGVVSTCAVNGTAAAGLCIDAINGTSLNPIYYGVDPGWFSGGSWARPTLTADNPLCNSGTVGTLSDGATCTGTTDSFGQPSYYVSACGFQVGNTNNLVDVGFSKNIIVDNFELTGLCQADVGQPGGEDSYVNYSGAQAPLTFQNLYIHGASHLRFADKNGFPGCTSSTVCFNLRTFYGSVINGSVGETVANNVVDFVDSDPGGQGLCEGGGFYNVHNNVFRYTSQCLPNIHLFHDNLYEFFFENGHSNMIESSDPSGTNAVYNNVFRHVENLLTSGGGVAIWLGPVSGATDYMFNNVIYDVGSLEYLNVGGVALTQVLGNYVYFNNTFQINVSQAIMTCNGYTNGTLGDTNNNWIDSTGYVGSCPTLTSTTDSIMSNATATSDGYTSSQANAYSPTSNGSPTVGRGTNETSGYCRALSSAGLNAAATACQSDTTYACSYPGNGAAPVCPARTVNVRPGSGAWDIGAYDFTQGSVSLNPPNGLTAVVN